MYPEPTRIRVVSTDVGLDDALALILLKHYAPESLDYVVGTGGNVPADLVANNLAALAERYGFTGRLYRGSDPPGPVDAREVHGPYGLGNMRPRDVSLPPVEELAHDLGAHGAEIDLLVLGPATDAAALLEHEEVAPRIRNVLMMGGAFRKREGRLGNVTDFAEFNVYADPGAAQRLLKADCDVRLVPLDATESRLFTTNELLPDRPNTPAMEFAAKLVRYLADAHARLGEGQGVYMHDVIAAAIWVGLLTPDWRTAGVRRIVTEGEKRGYVECGEVGIETRYAEGFDPAEFLRLWGQAVSAL
jgi:inosine-uridine nucleoside N-ribohydrolase